MVTDSSMSMLLASTAHQLPPHSFVPWTRFEHQLYITNTPTLARLCAGHKWGTSQRPCLFPDAPYLPLHCPLHLHLSSYPSLLSLPSTPFQPCTLHQLPFHPHLSLISSLSICHTPLSISSKSVPLPQPDPQLLAHLHLFFHPQPPLPSHLIPISFLIPTPFFFLPFLSFTPISISTFPLPHPQTQDLSCSSYGM